MGCSSSLQQNKQENQLKSQDFKLTYRQFIANSRGEVFQIYHFSNLIHRGITSSIRKVFHRVNGMERVCKIIRADNIEQLSCIQQIEMLKNMEHPNVVKVQEYFIEKHFVYIVFQNIEGLSLQQTLTKSNEIPFSSVVSIMKQLFSVVNMMHKQSIAHRNIHPGHIMLSIKKDQYMLKLIDFSSSCYSYIQKLKPPKPYRYQKAFNSNQSETDLLKHDIYCCGLIFLILLGGSSHLKNIRGNQQKTIEKIINNNAQLKHTQFLLNDILKASPEERPTAAQILNHAIFAQNSIDLSNGKIILNNLRKCNIKGKLKSTLWMFATIKLQAFYNKIQLMNQFYSLDKNKDGKIQFSELKDGLIHTFGIPQEEAQQQTEKIFSVVDKNNSGELDFYQFVMGAYLVGKKLSNKELKILFDQIDLNKDGIISQSELNEAIEGVQQFQLIANLDSKFDLEAFAKIMRSYIAKISKS